jgi:hypothetical protein
MGNLHGAVRMLVGTLPSFTLTLPSIADPDLTDLGKLQAVEINQLWKTEIAAHIPLPQKVYSSPLTRALRTNVITFEGIPLSDNAITIIAEVRLLSFSLMSTQHIIIILDFAVRRIAGKISGYTRATNGGARRTSKPSSLDSELKKGSRNQMNYGRLENMRHWLTSPVGQSRCWTIFLTTILKHVSRPFDLDELALSVSLLDIYITAHMGIIRTFLSVLNRAPYALPTGGVLPIVVKSRARSYM